MSAAARTTVGITGHISITPHTRRSVTAEIARILADLDSTVTGYTSLAPGADQVFTWVVVGLGGDIVFVSPCSTIESTIPETNRPAFDAARSMAADIVTMPHTEPSEQAYFDAGAYIADTVDLLIAVWDGQPAGGFGGTADIVTRRQRSRRPLVIVWPEGSARG